MSTPVPPRITREDIAAAMDRLVPVVQRYRELYPLPETFVDLHYPVFMPPTLFLSQYSDPHSRYHGYETLLAEAWRDIECVLVEPQPQWPAYDTGFEIQDLYHCYRTAEGVLSDSQLDQLRGLFRPLGDCLMEAGRWDFEADDRTNPALVRAADLAVCGWVLDDARMREESRSQIAAILERVDENDVSSELSVMYLAQMLAWALPACEVEPRPDLLRLVRAMCRLVPLLLYEPTLELIGPDCRDQWKPPCRMSTDALLLGLRGAAVLLGDEESEWLSRTLFHQCVVQGDPERAAYSRRAPRYIGVARYGMGYGAVDAMPFVGGQVSVTGAKLATLKRWLSPDVAARRPEVRDEYRSSKLFLRRYRNGDDVMALANIAQPMSYMTTGTGLQGIELWTDDWFFWFDLCGFRETAGSEEAFSLVQVPNPKALERKTKGPPEGTVHGAAKCGDHLISLTKIECRQELVPGIVSWAGMLLVADKEGEVVFGRGGEIGRGRVDEEQNQCDWILYPCDERRRFGFGVLVLETTGHSTRLSNFGGDWCVCGLEESAEPTQGLRALLVLVVGPWEGTPEEYAAWLRAWQVAPSSSSCDLTAPDGRCLRIPYLPAGQLEEVR